jgi:hypothetical protein
VTFNTLAIPQTLAGRTGNLLPVPTRPIQHAVEGYRGALTAWAVIFGALRTVFRVAAIDCLTLRKVCGSAPVREEKDDRVAHRE